MNALGRWADALFEKIELGAYLVLGLLLAAAALIGMTGAGVSLWAAALGHAGGDMLLIAIDRLLFVFMIVEILHTVRVSFRAGALVCEPFLVVGLIASIRRVLVITLESSQVDSPGKLSPEAHSLINSSMLELCVLGGLIVIMVVAIVLLRRSDPHRPGPTEAARHP
jgi:uncharacterized membrane protein (DUF373 family)